MSRRRDFFHSFHRARTKTVSCTASNLAVPYNSKATNNEGRDMGLRASNRVGNCSSNPVSKLTYPPCPIPVSATMWLLLVVVVVAAPPDDELEWKPSVAMVLVRIERRITATQPRVTMTTCTISVSFETDRNCMKNMGCGRGCARSFFCNAAFAGVSSSWNRRRLPARVSASASCSRRRAVAAAALKTAACGCG